eukprot:CCRYP_008494-RA/>CCRYP_008494-RA protein AED:0.11 eAED:0.08 QI:0/0/0/1/0/0/2/0/144
MYFACQLCYIFTIVTTIILSITALSYAPRQSECNVCTDQLAWTSIVEGMTARKMSASFDLFISVYNPNRWEVDLSNGAGQFHLDGDYVGSFTIPPGKTFAAGDYQVKIPVLGYQFDAKFENIEVNPSDPSMRDPHLCACPGDLL